MDNEVKKGIKKRMKCLNCGKEFEKEAKNANQIVLLSRGSGKTILALTQQIKQNTCCDACAKELWEKLWNECEERFGLFNK